MVQALSPAQRSRGPIKSERNRAAAASGSNSAGLGQNSASSTSSAFHKRRAQGKPSPHSSYDRQTPKDSQQHSYKGKQSSKSGARPASAQATQEQPKHDVPEQDSSEEEEEDDEEEDFRSKTALSLAGHPLPPLAALVDTLSQFRYLQRLDLSSIEASDASPDGLSSLTWLAKAVFRSKAQIEAASSKGKERAFGDHLTWLNLSSNSHLTSEACIGLEALEELCVLNLSHCALSAIPPSISPLRNLKALVLNNNAIAVLPKSFPHLPELNSLILSHNELTALPASLPASLPALKKLSLGHNKLRGSESLPDFSLCLALREVRLNDNPELNALPSHVRNWGKGANGKTAPGLELLELKDCGLDTWESLSTLAEVEDEKEQQPRLRRKGLTQLLLKGNGVAEQGDYKDRILQVHPTLRVLDNERLQPRMRPADIEKEEGGEMPTKRGDDARQKKENKYKAKREEAPKKSAKSAQKKREPESEEDDDDDDAAAQMAAEMRALRRGKPTGGKAEAPSDDDDDDGDDDEAAQMAAEMRALRRGKPAADSARPSKKGGERTKPDKSKDRKPQPGKAVKDASKKLDARATSNEDADTKPKHKRGTRSGKKVKKAESLPSDRSASATDSKKDARGGGFFETVDVEAEKARLAPIYELSKQRARIATGRTEVAEGVLEDAKSTLSKARQREALGRTELDTFDDATPANAPAAKRKAKKPAEVAKPEAAPVNTSVAAIVDVRKKDKKRKAAPEDAAAGKKKPRASLPFAPAANATGDVTNKNKDSDTFGAGADAWGAGGAWS